MTEQDPQAQGIQTLEYEQGMFSGAVESVRSMPQVVAAEHYFQDGMDFMKGKIPGVPSGKLIAAAAVAGGLALGMGANTETSKAHHVDPNRDAEKEFAPCIENPSGTGTLCYGPGLSRVEQYMANWRQNTAPNSSVASSIVNDISGQDKRQYQRRQNVGRILKIRTYRPEITADDPSEPKPTNNEFYSGARTMAVIKNKRTGNMTRASNINVLASNTSKGFNKFVRLKLNKKGLRAVRGDNSCKTELGFLTRTAGISRELNDRDQYRQYESARDFNLDLSCKRKR